MRVEPNDYLEAARDRITDAHSLYDVGRYSFSLYAAGLAVESLLRAYRVLRNPEFEERHDLRQLLAESGMEEFVTKIEYSNITNLVFTIFLRWKNDLRFASEGRLKRRLKRLQLDRGIRGDFVKENCRLSIEAASRIVKIGVAKWTHR
jgi:hypothetical protein